MPTEQTLLRSHPSGIGDLLLNQLLLCELCECIKKEIDQHMSSSQCKRERGEKMTPRTSSSATSSSPSSLEAFSSVGAAFSFFWFGPAKQTRESVKGKREKNQEKEKKSLTVLRGLELILLVLLGQQVVVEGVLAGILLAAGA